MRCIPWRGRTIAQPQTPLVPLPSPPAGKLPIPLNSPVFFAMKCTGEDEYNFVLEPKTPQ